MMTVLFQRIPRCLFEAFAILGLIGLVSFLVRHWKKDKTETVLWGGTVLFMLAWRMAMPINADRYALLLMPVAVCFSVYAIEEIVKYPEARLFLIMLFLGCGWKSFGVISEDRHMFSLLEKLKTDAGAQTREKIRVVSNRDVSCFLGDGFSVQVVDLHGEFFPKALPDCDYCLLKLKRGQLPSGNGISDKWEIRPKKSKSFFVLWKRNKKK